TVDKMDFRPNGPHRPGRARLDLLNDVFGRTGVVSRLHRFPGHFGMDDYPYSWMLGTEAGDLADGEPGVDRAVPLPQNDSRAANSFTIETPPWLGRIPHDHLVKRNAKLVGGIATEVLVRQKQHFLAALPSPLEGRRRVR